MTTYKHKSSARSAAKKAGFNLGEVEFTLIESGKDKGRYTWAGTSAEETVPEPEPVAEVVALDPIPEPKAMPAKMAEFVALLQRDGGAGKQEICETMGIKPAAVYSYLFRANMSYGFTINKPGVNRYSI